MNGGQKDDFIDATAKKYGRNISNTDYGARFNRWLMTDSRTLQPVWKWLRRFSVCCDEYNGRETTFFGVTHNHQKESRSDSLADAILYPLTTAVVIVKTLRKSKTC